MSDLISLSAADLEQFETCPRRYQWTRTYAPFRISLTGALYSALHAGLTASGTLDPETSARNRLMALAAQPGLDIEGEGMYDAATHLASLAGILTVYLRGGEGAWTRVAAKEISAEGKVSDPNPPPPRPARVTWERHKHRFDPQAAPVISSSFLWESSCYEAPDSYLRRVVLVDHWNEDRRVEEQSSWRTVAECALLDRPVLLNVITIGKSLRNRRYSAWTKGLLHPNSHQLRFMGRHGNLGNDWNEIWRERWNGSTDRWLGVMQADGVMKDLVRSVKVSVPGHRQEIVNDILRMQREMAALSANPPMRRAGCFGFSRCQYVPMCHGGREVTPGEMGHPRREQVEITEIQFPHHGIELVPSAP